MKTNVETSKAGAAQFEHVEAGIYRNIDSGTYFERPQVRGDAELGVHSEPKT